ncbi:hypothetical protein GCM10020331_007170 [Ectobacillus funiculus]
MLAESVGVKQGNTFIINNGDVVDIEHTIARQTRKNTGWEYLRRRGDVGNVGEFVLRDRKQLSEDGMLMIVFNYEQSGRKN